MYVVQAGGPGFLLAVVIGVIGIGLAIGGLLGASLSKGPGLPFAAAFILVSTSLCGGCTGVLSYGSGISKMNRALEDSSIEPELRRSIEAQGSFEASIPLMAGIGGSILPGIAGIACLAIGMKRRSQPRPIE